MSVTAADAHAATSRLDTPELVRQLNSHLGPTLVAALAGVADRKLPHKWARPDGVTPGPDRLRRLQFAHRTWSQISAAEDDHVARAWFVGANPVLDETTPVEAIRNDQLREVTAAVSAFLDDAGSA